MSRVLQGHLHYIIRMISYIIPYLSYKGHLYKNVCNIFKDPNQGAIVILWFVDIGLVHKHVDILVVLVQAHG